MRGSIRAFASVDRMSSATPIETAPVGADDDREVKRSPLRMALAFCRHEPLGAFGMLLVLLMAFAAASADWLAPFDPTSNDFSAMAEAPSWTHLLGTDQFGRDVYSRILFGAQTAMIVGFTCAFVGGADRERARAHDARAARNQRDGDGDDDVVHAGAEDRDDRERQYDQRKRHQHIEKA